MSPEEFEEWRTHPYTEKFREAMSAHAEDIKERWLQMSWDQGNADPNELAVMRAQAAMAEDLASMEYERVASYFETEAE